MVSYDKAYGIADDIKKSDEYKEYISLKEAVFENEINRDLYKEFTTISMSINAAYLGGNQPDDDVTAKYQQLMSVLSLNGELLGFIQAEYRIKQIVSDIFKIITDAADMNLDFLGE